MRAKRAVVLAAMLGFVALTLSLVVVALPDGEQSSAPASQSGAQPFPATPDLDEEAGAASLREGGLSGFPVMIIWIGAVVSGSGVVVSFMVFRVEVRKEKDAIRARKNRADYYKDLRKYNAQLRGPPRDNT